MSLEPYLRVVSTSNCISVSVKNKPLDCKADIRYFKLEGNRGILKSMDKLPTDISHSMAYELEKGDYWVTAVLHLAEGGRKILEGNVTVKGSSVY